MIPNNLDNFAKFGIFALGILKNYEFFWSCTNFYLAALKTIFVIVELLAVVHISI